MKIQFMTIATSIVLLSVHAKSQTFTLAHAESQAPLGSMQQNQDSSSSSERSSLSMGGLLLEPILFISQEDSSVRTSQLPLVNNDTSGNSTGYGLGIRMGGHVSEILMLGFDARYSKTQSDDSFFDESDADVYNIAPAIGLKTPFFGVRLMAAYVVAGESNPSSGSDGLNLKYNEANGLRMGAGLYIAAVSVNLEYQDLDYNNTEIESRGSVAFNESTDIDANSKGYALSVSFPLEY